MSYGDGIWNKCGRTNTNKLQQAQNYAAKSILGISKYSSSKESLKKLELLPLEDKRNIHTAVFVKKCLEGQAPKALTSRYNSFQRPVRLRQGNLQLPTHRTQQYENGPLYSSLKIWNEVPQNLKQTNLTNFKNEFQKQKLSTFLAN